MKRKSMIKRSNIRKLQYRFLCIPIIIIILIFILVIVLYICNFPNGFSNKQEVWGYFGEYFGGTISPVLSFTSFFIALYVLYKTAQNEKFDHIYKFMNDYRSERMSKDLKLLWDFYNYENYKKRTNKVREEKKTEILKQRYKNEHDKMTEIYLARRNVSYFYLYLSIFLKSNKLNEEILCTLWPSSGLHTLREIIMPCEKAITAQDKTPDKFIHFNYLIEKLEQYDKGKS